MDLLERIRQEMKQRLDELRPQIEQIPQLERALHALKREDGQPGSRAATRRPRGSAASTRPRGAGTRRRGGRRTRVSGQQRREQLIALAKQKPTISVRELADSMGTTPNNIYNIVRRLEAEGSVTRADGRFSVRA